MYIPKTLKRIISLLLVVILCTAALGCQSEEERLAAESIAASIAEESRLASEAAAEESRLAAEAAEKEAKLRETENTIIEILQWTPAIDGWSLTLAEAINRTFHNYKWSFELQKGSTDRYIVTFSGNYSPNPRDLPQLSYSGSISWIVDLSDNSINLYSDPNSISSAFILIALPY